MPRKICGTFAMLALLRLCVLTLCGLFQRVGAVACPDQTGTTKNTGDCQCGTVRCTTDDTGLFCQNSRCHSSAFGSDALPNGLDASTHNDQVPGLKDLVAWWFTGYTDVVDVVGKYGHIMEWDVSDVTNMKDIFKEYTNFNADLSKWQTGKVTDMTSSKFTTDF